MVYFTSDMHFGHKNVLMHDGRPFDSVEEMDAELIARWNSVVREEDTVYVLGDISWHKGNKTAEIFKQLNGHKHLIKGNHDRMHKDLDEYFESVNPYAEIRYYGNTFILSHYPIHFYNKHHYGAVMLYGHVHNTQEEDYTKEFARQMHDGGIPCKMLNVGCMLWDFTPVSMHTVCETVGADVKLLEEAEKCK